MDMGKLRGKLKTLIDTVILKSESKELHLSFGLYAASKHVVSERCSPDHLTGVVKVEHVFSYS